MDTRWMDGNKLPLSNGPFRTVTPPARLEVNLNGDVQVVEFMLPFPMHLVDPQPWDPIRTSFQGYPVAFEKPLMSMEGFDPRGRLGNESPDAYCTILRAASRFDASRAYPEPRQLWPLVDLLLQWIRVKARHYWLLHGHTGFGSVFRGSVISQRGNQVEVSNFASYGQSVIVRPLSQALWGSIANELLSGAEPPVSEGLFCDALVSAVAGEDIKAILQLGVAAEVAITTLLMDVASAGPTNHQKRKFLSGGERDTFYSKLQDWPSKLSLRSVKSFNPKGTMKDWVDLVKELYGFRGSVAHSGRVRPGSVKKNISSYIFATSTLLRYCREQAEVAGIPVYSYPSGELPFDQVVAFIDVIVDGVAGGATPTVS